MLSSRGRSHRDRGFSRGCPDALGLGLSVRSVRRRYPERPGSLRADQGVENGASPRGALGQPDKRAGRQRRKKSFPDVKKLIGSVRPLALRVRNAPRQLLGPQGFAGSSEFHAFEAFWGPCRAAGVTLDEALISHDLRRRPVPRDACALCRPIGIIARGQPKSLISK